MSDTTSSPVSASDSTLPSSPTSSIYNEKDPKDGFPREFPPLPTSVLPTEVNQQDKQTPDSWVKRDERLVRLTGKHPFNSEAKLGDLFAA
ncbi:hypothetical protein FRC07_010108, partial [Ceratobasidium sp. 392]